MDEIIGYKWLAELEDGTLVSPVAYVLTIEPGISFYGNSFWENEHLDAQKPPSMYGDDGVHAYKYLEEAQKCEYWGYWDYWGVNRRIFFYGVLVKLILSGMVIEGEWGYRAQYADIACVIARMTCAEVMSQGKSHIEECTTWI